MLLYQKSYTGWVQVLFKQKQLFLSDKQIYIISKELKKKISFVKDSIVRNCKISSIKFLIEHRAMVNYTPKIKDDPPIIYELTKNIPNEEIINYLIEQKAILSGKSNSGSALHIAINNINCSFELIKKILEVHPLAINQEKTSKNNKKTPLFYSIKRNRFDVFSFLIEKKATFFPRNLVDICSYTVGKKLLSALEIGINQINIANSSSSSSISIYEKNLEKTLSSLCKQSSTVYRENSIKYIFDILMKMNYSSKKLIEIYESIAIDQDSSRTMQTIKYIFYNKARDKYEDSILFNTICYRRDIDIDTLKHFLTNADIDINMIYEGSNSFHNLCGNRNTTPEMLRYMLNVNALPDQMSLSRLCNNTTARSLEMFSILIENKSNVDLYSDNNLSLTRKQNILHFLSSSPIRNDTEEIFFYLLERKANINHVDKMENNPLHIAFAYQKQDFIERLSRNFPLLIYKKNKRSFTPLDLLFSNINIDIAYLEKFLATEKDYQTISNYLFNYSKNASLSFEFFKKIFEKLLEYIPKDKAFTMQKYLIHKLCKYSEDKQAIRFLVENGFSLNQPNPSGETPILYASVHSSPDIIFLLLDLGACPNESSIDGTGIIEECIKRDDISIDTIFELLNRKCKIPDKFNFISKMLNYECIERFGLPIELVLSQTFISQTKEIIIQRN